jgi:hypothetical protein
MSEASGAYCPNAKTFIALGDRRKRYFCPAHRATLGSARNNIITSAAIPTDIPGPQLVLNIRDDRRL